MRAVDALMESLKAEGVEVVFGLPGGANLPTYDAFVDAGIRHILVRHEAGGGHAAEGYAKVGSGAHHLFEAQVSRTPDAVALLAGGSEFTYAELNKAAEDLGIWLSQAGVGP